MASPTGGSGQGDLLAADRTLLDRISTAERVADILRTRIIEGYFAPGTRLSEYSIGTALGVSRNTLREAFRLLTHERLLAHELNRGVFVRVLSVDDVRDLYRVRATVECAAVRTVTATPPSIDRLAAAVAEGVAAHARQGWQDLGTANIHFHQAIAALAGSPRLDELMRGIFAELRLVFHTMRDPRRFHEPYLAGNTEILARLRDGDGAGAELLLRRYLEEAQAQIVAAYPELSG
jgi:DNA-binding GntR family transcriptional regulator